MNQTQTGLYETLGRLLTYPTKDVKQVASECYQKIQSSDSPATVAVADFVAQADKSSVAEMQELYTRTFEINPVCALEVGWQLFGERYERGTFIVKMRETLRDLNIPESTELPDHLVHVLQAMDRLEQEEATQFAGLFLVPAVNKMIAGFKDNNNVYRGILGGLVSEVKTRFSLPAQGVNDE